MLENANEIILHGFAYKDFIREIPNPQVCPRSKSLCLIKGGSRTGYRGPDFAGHSALNEIQTCTADKPGVSLLQGITE